MRTSLFVAAVLAAPALAGPTINVSFDKALREQPATGRLIIYAAGADAGFNGAPAMENNWDGPEPRFGIDVKDLAPGAAVTIGDDATSFPAKLSQLPAGKYRLQAVLDLHRDNSEWRREPGNLYSDPITATIDSTTGAISLPLTHAVAPEKLPDVPGVEWFEMKSELLSTFHHRPISLHAGVVLPTGYDASQDRRYPAIYEVPGFGGDHRGAAGFARRAAAPADSPDARLARAAFWIVLDPESGNGHTLFADSANNGPCAQALITELIPALEAKYKLIAQPSARLLRGHSSGGWSTLWLALNYPATFGATWSTSPDPVDFHRFQLPDIYDPRFNFYHGIRPGADAGVAAMQAYTAGLPSVREHGKTTMTIEQENLMEEVLGPDNTSGQQWDSWEAVFGPRNDRGNAAALFDPQTGAIDRAIAEQYRKYDITDLLRNHPDQYLPIFRDNVRIVVGDQDTFYLNEAVALLKAEVDELNSKSGKTPGWGSIEILPGFDHGTIFSSPQLQSIPQQMLDRLTKSGHIPQTK
jgi:hypothetical protein